MEGTTISCLHRTAHTQPQLGRICSYIVTRPQPLIQDTSSHPSKFRGIGRVLVVKHPSHTRRKYIINYVHVQYRCSKHTDFWSTWRVQQYSSLSLDMKPSILTLPTPSLILGKSSHRYNQGKMKPSLFYKGYVISLCWIKATRTSRTAHKYLCGRSTAGYDGLLGSLGQSRVTQQQL